MTDLITNEGESEENLREYVTTILAIFEEIYQKNETTETDTRRNPRPL